MHLPLSALESTPPQLLCRFAKYLVSMEQAVQYSLARSQLQVFLPKIMLKFIVKILLLTL